MIAKEQEQHDRALEMRRLVLGARAAYIRGLPEVFDAFMDEFRQLTGGPVRSDSRQAMLCSAIEIFETFIKPPDTPKSALPSDDAVISALSHRVNESEAEIQELQRLLHKKRESA